MREIKNVAIYCRTSLIKSDISRQVFELKALAEFNKWQIVEVYTDEEAEYERQLFHKAADTFSLLVLEYPKCVRCLHMKGKSLGRLAENSSWIKAMAYVPRALASFETAHRLAPENKAIIQDLITFYERAPFFLGGNLSKAQKLRKRLGAIK